MLLAELVRTSARVAATSRRTEKQELLAACLRALPPAQVALGATYLAGQLRQKRTGAGHAALMGALTQPAAPEPGLELVEVDRALDLLSEAGGPGVNRRRQEILSALFTRATKEEQDFLARLMLGALRQGALEALLLEAAARASGLPVQDLQRAQMVAADVGLVVGAALTEGPGGLARFTPRLFAPLLPMLAETAADVEDALAQLGEACFEWKLDGARIQVHKREDEVRVYSRRQNEVTERVPELVEQVRGLPARELMLDGEILALGPGGGPLPFQLTMRRFSRKRRVEAARAEQALSPFFFDLLAVDGQSLLSSPGSDRLRALDRVVPAELRVPRLITRSAGEAEAFFARALQAGHEGLMAKALGAPYEAGSRGASWLKLKKAHTLDLLVLAVEWGSGRRQGTLSNLHLGARDPTGGPPVMLGKTFKGLSDEMLAWQTRRLLELETRREGHVVYVRPELVVEVAFADVQASPHYPGGVALRFARVKRHRPDKSPDQADTLDAVLALLPRGLAREE